MTQGFLQPVKLCPGCLLVTDAFIPLFLLHSALCFKIRKATFFFFKSQVGSANERNLHMTLNAGDLQELLGFDVGSRQTRTASVIFLEFVL